jgi:hypothetical protein
MSGMSQVGSICERGVTMICEQAIAPAKPMAARTLVASRGSAEAVLKLVEQWLAEDDGYDLGVWPIIRQDIEENRLSDRISCAAA